MFVNRLMRLQARALQHNSNKMQLMRLQHRFYFNDLRAGGAVMKIEQNQIDKLLTLQKNFDSEPDNIESAHEYFKELNRQGKYLTVVRLYRKNELKFRKNSLHSDKIYAQYTYASETIESLEKAMKTPSSPYLSTDAYANDVSQLVWKKWWKFVVRMIIVGLQLYALQYIMKEMGNSE